MNTGRRRIIMTVPNRAISDGISKTHPYHIRNCLGWGKGTVKQQIRANVIKGVTTDDFDQETLLRELYMSTRDNNEIGIRRPYRVGRR